MVYAHIIMGVLDKNVINIIMCNFINKQILPFTNALWFFHNNKLFKEMY